MDLRGERVVLRPLADEHVDRVAAIGAEPEVARWWNVVTAADVAATARGEEEGVTAFAILVDGEVAGMIQYHEENEPDYRHAGIDLFLGERHQGQGFGADAVRTLARHLIDDRGHHRLVIDPAAANERAIRCYEKVGFERVGVLRRYCRDQGGVWQDGLLLDLLAAELR